jgi:hypothetical protein
LVNPHPTSIPSASLNTFGQLRHFYPPPAESESSFNSKLDTQHGAKRRARFGNSKLLLFSARETMRIFNSIRNLRKKRQKLHKMPRKELRFYGGFETISAGIMSQATGVRN